MEAATIEAIAARAETSVGSVYQFFPNKRALFHAIGARYTERVRGLFEALVSSASSGTSRRAIAGAWKETLDRAIDTLDVFHRSDTGFRALLRNWSSAEMLEADDAINRELARRTESLISLLMPTLPRARRNVVAELLVETVSSALILSARRDRRKGAKVIAEAKTMLHRWLEGYARPAPASTRARGEREV